MVAEDPANRSPNRRPLAACPLEALAQRVSHVPRIGVLLAEADNHDMQARLERLRQGLELLNPPTDPCQLDMLLGCGDLMQFDQLRRREFITLLGGAAAAWPLAASAQQPERMRKIGVLMGGAAGMTDQQAGLAVFMQLLHQLGWTEDRNVQLETRWVGGDPARVRRYAEELVALPAEVIMTNGAFPLEALLRATRSVPIIFCSVTDPVGSGFVESLARPGGNATGFSQFEYTLTAKWLELLRQIAPSVTRVEALRDPTIVSGIGQFAVIQYVAASIGIEVSAINLRDDASEIEQAVKRYANSPNGGLILTGSALSLIHHNLIIALAAQHKLPTVYYRRYYVTSGGLISYGFDIDEQFRGAARYVDRILKGDKPADLRLRASGRDGG
jgi:putative ABC transport system substrate-binding protein